MPKSIAEQLKDAREKNNISLIDVVDELHIRIEYLQALENNQHELLPSQVQGKGFLRLYAEYLNLNAETLVAQWNGVILEEPEDTAASKPAESANQENIEKNSEETMVSEKDITDVTDPVEETQATAAQLFKELGQLFSRQRKALQLSLEDIENATHIRKNNLAAIENNQYADLPSSVQAKGMLENYAAYLNLDVDRVMETYAEALQLKRHETQIETQKQSKKTKKKLSERKQTPIRRLITPDLIVGSALIVVILIVAILSIAKVVNTNREQDFAVANQSQTDASATETIATQTATLAADQTSTPTAEVLIIPDETTQIPDNLENTFPSNPNARIQLHLTANQRAWLRVIVDDEVQFDGRVLPGAAYQFYGEEKIDLLTGNAGAFSAILIQDQETVNIGSLGVVAQVYSITILPETIITPTALPTATPTITNTPPLPTETETPSPTEEENTTP